VVGSASAAVLGGWRYSTFNQTQTTSGTATECDLSGPVCIGPFPFNDAQAVSLHHSQGAIVGDLAASLGVGWRPAPAVSVEVGYRVEDLINVRDSFKFAIHRRVIRAHRSH
jgi:hypothetical protein